MSVRQPLPQATQALLGGIHAFVYVIDSSSVKQQMNSTVQEENTLFEFQQVLNPQWTQRHAPVLILSAHSADTTQESRASTVQVGFEPAAVSLTILDFSIFKARESMQKVAS